MEIKQLKLNGLSFYPKVAIKGIVNSAGTATGVDEVVTSGSDNLITSGGVYNAIQSGTDISDKIDEVKNYVDEEVAKAKYTLPIATVDKLGGVTVVNKRNQTPSIEAITDTEDRYYGVECDYYGRLFVNVPWSKGVDGNFIETVKLNNVALTVTDSTVNIPVDQTANETSTNPIASKVAYALSKSIEDEASVRYNQINQIVTGLGGTISYDVPPRDGVYDKNNITITIPERGGGEGGDENVIESITVNGTSVPVNNKVAKINLNDTDIYGIGTDYEGGDDTVKGHIADNTAELKRYLTLFNGGQDDSRENSATVEGWVHDITKNNATSLLAAVKTALSTANDNKVAIKTLQDGVDDEKVAEAVSNYIQENGLKVNASDITGLDSAITTQLGDTYYTKTQVNNNFVAQEDVDSAIEEKQLDLTVPSTKAVYTDLNAISAAIGGTLSYVKTYGALTNADTESIKTTSVFDRLAVLEESLPIKNGSSRASFIINDDTYALKTEPTRTIYANTTAGFDSYATDGLIGLDDLVTALATTLEEYANGYQTGTGTRSESVANAINTLKGRAVYIGTEEPSLTDSSEKIKVGQKLFINSSTGEMKYYKSQGYGWTAIPAQTGTVEVDTVDENNNHNKQSVSGYTVVSTYETQGRVDYIPNTKALVAAVTTAKDYTNSVYEDVSDTLALIGSNSSITNNDRIGTIAAHLEHIAAAIGHDITDDSGNSYPSYMAYSTDKDNKGDSAPESLQDQINSQGQDIARLVNNPFVTTANLGAGNETITVGGIAIAGGNRPAVAPVGFCFFDTNLSKPIWYSTSGSWVDATGATA